MLMFVVIVLFTVFMALLGNKIEDAARKRHKDMVRDLKRDLNYEKPVEQRSCPPHKWSYHPATEKLTCIVCNYVAGSDFDPRGSGDKPY